MLKLIDALGRNPYQHELDAIENSNIVAAEVRAIIGQEIFEKRAGYALVLGISEAIAYRENLDPSETIATVSGAFDPMHDGHINTSVQSRNHATQVWAIVNGDAYLQEKRKGTDLPAPFIPFYERVRIVAKHPAHDVVIPFPITNDETVGFALACIQPDFFVNGGKDRHPEELPSLEREVSRRANIGLLYMNTPLELRSCSSSKMLRATSA